MLLLQGELALGVPEPAQGVQPVLEEPRVRVALVPAHRAQALRQLPRVLGLEGQDLEKVGGKVALCRGFKGGGERDPIRLRWGFGDWLLSATDGGVLFLISGKG